MTDFEVIVGHDASEHFLFFFSRNDMLYFDYFEVKYPSVNVCSVTHWVRWYPWPLTIMVAFKLLRIVETPLM